MKVIMNNNLFQKILVIGIIISFFGIAIQPITSINIYDFPPEVEGDHFPCGVEYWWLYTMLTFEDGRQWDMCAQFFYVMNWTGTNWSETEGISYLRIQSWNRETGKYYDCFHESKHPDTFQHKKNIIDLKYYNSTMKGLYPNYSAHFNDDINNITLTVDVNAVSPPYQHFNKVVNGTIPLGTGVFNYWSIPMVELSGNLTVNGTKFNVTGVGYHEHLFGDRPIDGTFKFRFSSIDDLIKLNFLYLSILKWMLQPRTISWLYKMHIPHISVDNLRGYDWIWSAFDNGWSMIFVRLRLGYPFSFTEGPCYSVLILTDGTDIWEFSEVYVKIIQDKYLEESDLYIPLDYKIMGLNDDKRIFISFNSTTNFTRLFNKFTQIKSSEGGLFLAAGETTGYFENGEETILLSGRGTNTPYLLFPLLGYRSLEIQLLLPPDGLGFIINKITPRNGLRTFSFGFNS
jgi:predicted secreted hydrolase